jgi:hypothetical protein
MARAQTGPTKHALDKTREKKPDVSGDIVESS